MPEVSLLSPRQTQTLQYLANGLSYKEAAIAMGISISSVKTYVCRAGKKLKRPSSYSTLAFAVHLNLIVIDVT